VAIASDAICQKRSAKVRVGVRSKASHFFENGSQEAL
jgi:hypothetical protein